MSRSLIAILITAIASSTGLAQAVPATPPVKLTQEQATQLNLARLEELWAIALIRRDRAAFERMLAPKFVYTINDTLVHRPEYVVRLLTSGDLVADARVDSVEVQAAGNIGVVTGWRIISGRGRDGPFERRYRFTDTWMPRSGSWQMISGHEYLAVVK